MKDLYKIAFMIIMLLSSMLSFSQISGAISGTVTDNNMNPIEGAIITVDNTSHTATSGEDGTYVITDVEPGVYDIIAEAEGYNTEWVFEQEVISGDTTIVDFILESWPGSLHGYVIDSLVGCPLQGVTVTASNICNNSKPEYIAYTGSDGYYIFDGLSAGIWEITAGGGYYYLFSKTIEILSGQSYNLNISLIRCTPILISATPGIEEITLIWEPIPEAPREGIKTGHFNFVGGDPNYPLWTIYIGVAIFETLDLEAGDEIGIFDGDLLVGAFTLDQVCTPNNQFENDLHAFSVLANGEQGYTPGNSFTFVAWNESSNSESFFFEYVFSDPFGDAWTGDVFPWDDGEYSMAEITFLGHPPCTGFNIYYEDGTLIAECVFGTSYTDINLIAGQEYCYYVTQRLEGGEESLPSNILCAIPLSEPPGAISGTVTDNNMNPIEGAIITVNNTSHTATTGEDGTYVITDVEPGVYDIIATAEGYEWEWEFDQEVISSETTIVDFILTALPGYLEGYVLDSITNMPIEGASIYFGMYVYCTGSDGYYWISGIEPGTHVLSVSAYGYYPYSTTIELLPGQSIDLNIYLIKIAPILLSAISGIEEITLTWEPVPNPPEKDNKTGHFIFNGGNPSSNIWTIYVGGATFDGIDMETGDEIGVFNEDILVGAFTLDQVCTPDNQFDNDLWAFSILRNGDPGYSAGNNFTFIAWDESQGIESQAFEVVFSNPYGGAWTGDYFPYGDGEYSMAEFSFFSFAPVYKIYYEDGTLIAEGIEGNVFTDTELIPFQEYCYYVTQILENGTESFASNILCAVPLSSNTIQSYNLVTGYQFISTRIIHENPDMLSVFEDILNDNLDYVRNSLGQTLRKIGPNWVNGIGDWIIDEGYLVKMFADDFFIIGGDAIDPATPIPVETGYQFVSYFPETPMDAMLAFETIIGDDLDFIRNSQGEVLRKIGPNWVNGIGDCQPGEGYLVKMFADGEIIYPVPTKLSGKTTALPSHFIFEGGNAADPVYTIYIEGLNIGDEIAAFDGDILIGAMKVNSQNAFDNDLPVFNTINSGKGYTPGNPLILKAWNKSENAEYILNDYTFSNPYGDAWTENVFPTEDGEYSLLHFSTTGISDENVINDISIYPNPTTGIITIGNLAGFENLQGFEIIDISGKTVFQSKINNNLAFISFRTGRQSSIEIDLSWLEKGVYFLNISGKEFNQVKKIVIQ